MLRDFTWTEKIWAGNVRGTSSWSILLHCIASTAFQSILPHIITPQKISSLVYKIRLRTLLLAKGTNFSLLLGICENAKGQSKSKENLNFSGFYEILCLRSCLIRDLSSSSNYCYRNCMTHHAIPITVGIVWWVYGQMKFNANR